MLRNIKKNLIFSISTLLSLSIGLAVGLISFLWVMNQLSYDSFHKNKEQIYRILQEPRAVNTSRASTFQLDLALRLKEQFPEIVNTAGISHRQNIEFSKSADGKDMIKIMSLPSDNGLFAIFSAQFINGAKEYCLDANDKVVITESLANSLYPGENPVGKFLYGKIKGAENKTAIKLFGITAVIKDYPENSFLADCKLFLNYMAVYEEDIISIKKAIRYGTKLIPFRAATAFVQIKKGSNQKNLENKISDFIYTNSNYHQYDGSKEKYSLQSLSDIHLNSEDIEDDNIKHNESITHVYIIAGIGMLFLLGGIFNYFSYSIILYNKRIKELGINKFLGAGNKEFALKFLSESIVLLAGATAVSFLMAEEAAPAVINWSIKNSAVFKLPPSHIFDILAFYFMALTLELLPVLYFMFLTGKIKTANMIMNKTVNLEIRKNLWRIFIVAQTAIPVFLIAAGLIVRSQVSFLENYEQGYSKKNILQFECSIKGDNQEKGLTNYKSRAIYMKSELEKCGSVERLTRTNWIPGFNNPSMTNTIKIKDKWIQYTVAEIDSNYFKIFNIKLIKSADISKISPGAFNYIAITEQTAKEWGIDYINQQLPIDFDNSRIVAITNNIHYGSFKEKKNGIVFRFSNDEFNHWGAIAVKYKEGKEADVRNYINSKWKEITGNKDVFTARNLLAPADLASEEILLVTVNVFSFITMFMALISIFSSISYNVECKTKEIGIRKVMGASLGSLFWLIVKELMALTLLAVITAAPFVYIALNKWLEDFCYRINIGVEVFIFTAVITSVIALATLSFTVIRAVSANPVESLKYE